MKKEWFLTSKEVVLELSLCGDVSARTEKLRKWSSFSHRFGHRSELPFIFEFFEVCSCSAWYLLLLAHSFWMLLEAWFHADINLLDECLQIQNQANMYIKSHRFLCHPYRSWEFHDHINYQCPGVTVPNGRRFWRALISRYIKMKLVKLLKDLLEITSLINGYSWILKLVVWYEMKPIFRGPQDWPKIVNNQTWP